MNFYEDLQFVHYGDARHTRDRAECKYFAGYYGVQFNYSGSMELWLGKQKKEVINGPHVFITYPGVEFNYGAVGEQEHSLIFICFRGSRVQKYIDEGLLQLRKQRLFIRITDSAKFHQKTMRLFAHLRQPGPLNHARAVLLLEEILLEIHEQPELPDKIFHLYGESINVLREKLAEAPEKNWDFQQEATKMRLSYVHFRRLFQLFTSMAPGQYLLECRLLKAEKFLISDTLRINEIAGLCGFDDAFHFSRIFKKHRSLAPLDFRRKFGLKETQI